MLLKIILVIIVTFLLIGFVYYFNNSVVNKEKDVEGISSNPNMIAAKYKKIRLENFDRRKGEDIKINVRKIIDKGDHFEVKIDLLSMRNVFIVLYDTDQITPFIDNTFRHPDHFIINGQFYIVRDYVRIPTDIPILYEAPFSWNLMILKKNQSFSLNIFITKNFKDKINYIPDAFYEPGHLILEGQSKGKIIIGYLLEEDIKNNEDTQAPWAELMLKEGKEFIKVNGGAAEMQKYISIDISL